MIRLVFILSLALPLTLSARIRQLRCTFREDPATSMVIAWNQASGNSPILFYDSRDGGEELKLYRSFRTPDYWNKSKGMYNHFVRLTGLKPDTEYFFLIKDSEGISKRYSFRTLPDRPDEPVAIIAGGDSRNNRVTRQQANRIISRLHPHVVLFGGDMTDDDTPEEWQNWLDDWELTVTREGRITPLLVCRGNHELTNETLVELFDLSNPEVYYALTVGGKLLRLYTLNTMIPSGGNQLKWLQEDLARNDRSTYWKIVQLHHSIRPHTSDKKGRDDLLINWATLFFKHSVDIAIECDAHVAKVTYPIRPASGPASDDGFVRDPKGTVYLGEGSWGAPLRNADRKREWTLDAGSIYQFSWLFIYQDRIEIRHVVIGGRSEKIPPASPNDPFQVPSGIEFWKPGGKEVIVIRNPDFSPEEIVASANEEGAEMIRSEPGGMLRLSVNPEKAGDVRVYVFDQLKQEVFRWTFPNMKPGRILKELDLSKLPRGKYLLVLKTADNTTRKFRLIRQ